MRQPGVKEYVLQNRLKQHQNQNIPPALPRRAQKTALQQTAEGDHHPSCDHETHPSEDKPGGKILCSD